MKAYCHLTYRIPFSETDAMGIVHHSNHIRYLERGRIELLRLVGHDYTKMVEQNLHFPVTGLTIEYKKPIAFDSIIIIETVVSEITRSRLHFSYKLLAGSELALPSLSEVPLELPLLAFGESRHCCVNEKGRPVEINSALVEELMRIRK